MAASLAQPSAPILPRLTNRVGDMIASIVSAVPGADRHLFLSALRLFETTGAKPTNILVLCQGNICRSPYAAARLENLFSERGVQLVSVHSAGIDTTPGKPADPTAIQVASEYGLDLSEHRTTTVGSQLISAAELIIVMEPDHRRVLLKQFPESRDRILLLGALTLGAGRRLTIRDPYAKDPTVYRNCFARIDESMAKLVVDLGGRQPELLTTGRPSVASE